MAPHSCSIPIVLVVIAAPAAAPRVRGGEVLRHGACEQRPGGLARAGSVKHLCQVDSARHVRAFVLQRARAAQKQQESRYAAGGVLHLRPHNPR